MFECAPDVNILERYFSSHQKEVGDLIDGFRKLNEELTKQLDKYHTVGHTFFMCDPLTRERLAQIWDRKIGPLIEEYCYSISLAQTASRSSPAMTESDRSWFRAKSVGLGQPMKNHLETIANGLGFVYGPHLYPAVLNLVNATPKELSDRFPNWNPAW